MTKEESVDGLKEYVQSITDGKLDILINNAWAARLSLSPIHPLLILFREKCSGIAYTMPAADTDVEAVEKMYAVNVFGPMRMVHHFHRMIIAVKGTIVNIGSIGGVTPYVYGSAYNGSKAALVHWGATLRIEMLPFG